MHPSLAAERENIIEKARAEAMRESAEIKEKAVSMAREITHKAHAQAVQATQAALLAAQQQQSASGDLSSLFGSGHEVLSVVPGQAKVEYHIGTLQPAPATRPFRG